MATLKACCHDSSYTFAKETRLLPKNVMHIRQSVHPSIHLSLSFEAASSLLLDGGQEEQIPGYDKHKVF